MPKQLLVDISELVNRDAKSGIQRVVRSILLQLLKTPPQGYCVEPVYSHHGADLLYARNFVARFTGNAKAVGADSPVRFSDGDVFLGLDLTAHLFPAFNSTLKRMRKQGVQIHYVVYDMTPLLHPQWHSSGMPTVFSAWLYSLAQHADGLVCISAAVAKDVERWLVESAWKLPRISYFHLGADIGNSVPTRGLPDTADMLLTKMVASPSFLMVGTLEPRKGHVQVLAGFEDIWASGVDVNLVIVGKVGWNVDALLVQLRSHPEAGGRLHWLESVSDEYLEKIYRASTALIAASEAEGFGLPLVEAARHQLRIIARGIPVFREIAGEHAFYFDGATPLAQSMRTWLAMDSEGVAPTVDGMRWLTWAQSTEQLLKNVILDW